MKQLFKSIAAIAIVATIFTSCSKDPASTTGTTEVGAPTLTITAPTAESNLRFNDVMTIKFTATPASGAKLKSILVTRTNTTSAVTVKVYGDSTASIADSATINRTVNDSVLAANGNVNDKFIYTILVIDNNGKSSTNTVSLNIKDLYSTGQFIVGAQNSTTTEVKFISLNENAANGYKLYKAGIANVGAGEQPSTADSATRARFNSEKIDLGVYFGTTNLTTIFSPSLTGTDVAPWATELGFWGKRNRTYIYRTNLQASLFSGTNFNIEQEIDKLDFTVATNQTELSKTLLSGNVVAFKTESGLKGLILVVAKAADASGFITLDVKYKK